MRWTSIAISLLIITSGLQGSRALTRVDQDLRVIHAEYTLAATDLGHVNGELIRYRTSVIRTIEADSEEAFRRIADSLPHKRARIDKAIGRFVKATNDVSIGKRMDSRELAELKAVQDKLDSYITSSHRTIQLMEQRWTTQSASEAQRLTDEAIDNAANDAGVKFIGVTSELDRLLEVVAQIAGEVKKDADARLRLETMIIVGVSVGLAMLVLVLPAKK